MKKDIDRILEHLEEHEAEMTEEEVFNSYFDILDDCDCDYDTIESLGIFHVPHNEYEDKYGNIHYESGYPEISKHYQNVFTKKHQQALMKSLYSWFKS